MKQQIRAAWLLSYDELLVLMKGQGCEGCYLLNSEAGRWQENNGIHVINSMAEKEIIESDGEKFIVRPEYKMLIKQLCQAEKIFVFHNKSRLPDFCVYIWQKQFIKCEVMQNHEKMYRFEYISMTNLNDDLLDYEVAYQDKELEQFNKKEISNQYHHSGFSFEQPVTRWFSDMYFMSCTEVLYKNNMQKIIAITNEQNLLNALLIYENGKVTKLPYTFEDFQNELWKD